MNQPWWYFNVAYRRMSLSSSVAPRMVFGAHRLENRYGTTTVRLAAVRLIQKATGVRIACRRAGRVTDE